MYSSTTNIGEAISQVEKVSCVFFTENFNEGIAQINSKTGLKLEPIHIRKATYKAEIPDSSISRLREMLKDEYEFLDRLKQIYI